MSEARRRRASWRAWAVATVALLGGCADSGTAADSPSTATVSPEMTIPESTIPETTVPEMTVPAMTVPATTIPETTIPETTTTTEFVSHHEAAARPAPLTGLPVTDPAQFTRPALVVKIDNHPAAKPQVGLDQADVVIEEVVEGITRFIAIYQSTIPDVVGPVRSARTQDALIVPMLGRPLFAWSGGNAGVRQVIGDAPLVDLSPQVDAAMNQWYRDQTREKPHDLFTRAAELYRLAPPDARPPGPLFSYRPEDSVPAGRPVSGAKMTLAGTRVEWVWNSGAGAWVRFQNGAAHRSASNEQVRAANVVLLDVEYEPSPADRRSPEAQTIGHGAVRVLTGGRVVEGTWSRPDVTSPWDLRDADGNPIALSAGRTWVELVPIGRSVVVEAGADAAAIPFPPK